MSTESERVLDEIARLEDIVGIVELGYGDTVRRVERLSLAVERIRAYRRETTPRAGERGGSSTIAELGERAEDMTVDQQAARDRRRLPTLLDDLVSLVNELHNITWRYTQAIDYDLIREPGCKSCARTEGQGPNKIGGHHSDVVPAQDTEIEGKVIRGNRDAHRAGLCRWCWDRAHDTADGQPVTRKHWPSVKGCDLYHTQTPRAAGLHEARRVRTAA